MKLHAVEINSAGLHLSLEHNGVMVLIEKGQHGKYMIIPPMEIGYLDVHSLISLLQIAERAAAMLSQNWTVRGAFSTMADTSILDGIKLSKDEADGLF